MLAQRDVFRRDVFEGILSDILNAVNKNRQSGFDAFAAKANYPRLNVYEGNGYTLIEAAVPGLSKEDISIEIKLSSITISGKSRDVKEITTLKEIKTQSFSREIACHESLDLEKAAAELKDGLLTIKVPSRVTSKVPIKQIAIN